MMMGSRSRGSEPIRPGAATGILLLLVVGIAAALVVLVTSDGPRVDGQVPAAPPAIAATEPQGGPADAGRRPSGGTVSASASDAGASPVEDGPSGEDLARAWLTAFCTRRDRDDNQWLVEVASISSPEVVAELRAEGPDAVGLASLTSWRVGRIDRIDLGDRPLETSTRQVLAYAVTVTDGTHTEQKPFVLYAYLSPQGSWRVEHVEQPYSSEG